MEESLALDGHLVSVKCGTYRVVHVIIRGRLAFLDRALFNRPLEWVWNVITRFELLFVPLMREIGV